MSAALIGALIAGLLAVVWVAWGFFAFLGVLVAMLVGAVVAKFVTGQWDFRGLLDALTRKSRS